MGVAESRGVEEIRKLPIFAGLSERDLAWLLERSRLVTVDPGDMVISRNVRPNHFTFLVIGRWTMRRTSAGSSEPLVVTDDRPGSWHGGLDTLDVLAPCDVQVDVLSRVLIAPRPAIHELMVRVPAFGYRMLVGVRSIVDKVADYAEKERGRAA